MTLRLPPLLAFVLLARLGLTAAAELPGPTGFPPLPGVVQFAQAHAIPLDGFAPAQAGEAARAGDRITVLFTIQEGATVRQWLAEFRLAALTEREAKTKPGSGLGLLSVFQASLKTDTGHEYSFAQSPAALELHTFGPFAATATAAPPDNAGVQARVLATRDYLAHGLAPMAEIELRLRAAGKKNPGLSYMFLARFSDAQLAATKARAQAAGFTLDDERAYAEGIYALVQFANLAFRTPGIAPIIQEMLDSPTLFSGAFVNLDWSAARLENGADWGLPAARVFRMPYNLQSKTQAKGTLFFTAPEPPLQNMAGIVGVTIDVTSKTSTKRLVVRVLASRRGP